MVQCPATNVDGVLGPLVQVFPLPPSGAEQFSPLPVAAAPSNATNPPPPPGPSPPTAMPNADPVRDLV